MTDSLPSISAVPQPDCEPFDPLPRPPAFVVPENACDCHFHLYGPYARYPLVERRPFTPAPATFEDCTRMHGALGIGRGVLVHSALNRPGSPISLHALRAAGGRWRGIAALHAGESIAHLGDLGALDAAGFRGVRLNFVESSDTSALEAVADAVRPFGWHVELLVKLDVLLALAPRLRALPVPCVVDHLGFTRAKEGVAHRGFQELLALLREGACWVKLSGADRIGNAELGYADALPYMRALVEADVSRLLWGTDWPHVRGRAMPNDGDLLNLFARAVPDAGMRRAILVDNPARLYRF
ncbi:MAG: amidohydrolase [Burkholderiaceae bacterium]